MKLTRRRVIYFVAVLFLALGLWYEGLVVPAHALYLIVPSGVLLFATHAVTTGMLAREYSVRAIRFGTSFKVQSDVAKERFGESAVWLFVLLVYPIRIIAGDNMTTLTWLPILFALGILFDGVAATLDALWDLLPQPQNDT